MPYSPPVTGQDALDLMGVPPSDPPFPPPDTTGWPVSKAELAGAIEGLELTPDIINNWTTNETYVTEVTEMTVNEITTTQQYITQITEMTINEITNTAEYVTQITEMTVNEITEVINNNSYITQITENNTFVTNVTNLTTNVINGKKGQASELATLAANSQLTHSQVPTEVLQSDFQVTIDGGGSVITTGTKAIFRARFACTITAWQLVGAQSGSLSVDVQKATYSGWPTTSSIVGAEKPALSSASKNEDTSLNGGAGWAVTAGDWIAIIVDGTPATVTLATLALAYTKTI